MKLHYNEIVSKWGEIIYQINSSNDSFKVGMILMTIALLVLAGVGLYILHMETDELSAELIDSGQCGPNLTYNVYPGGQLSIDGYGEMYQYDTTNAPWYEYREDITMLLIGNGVTKLGASAFKDCKNITLLYIPITLNSVVSDKCPAFSGCCSIEKINFTWGNGGHGYSYAAYDGSDSWYQNTPWYQSRDALKEINFSSAITHIGSDAFRELNITSIVIPDSVVGLGNHTFFNCKQLTDLTLPISLNSYGNSTYPAFNGCTAIQKVTLTKGNGVPFDYSNWRGAYCTNLAPWNINYNIGKTLVIADDITQLSKYMFKGCNIKDLTVPVGLYFGDSSSLCSADNLETVTITKGTGMRIDYKSCFASNNQSDSFCPWNYAPHIKTVTVEEGVRYLGSFMFYKCNIENLVLPNSLASFGKCVFYNCTVKNLTAPISLNTTWLDGFPAFRQVSGIETVTLTPGSGYGFDYAAYKGSNCWYQLTPWYQCKNTLKEVNFTEGITHIGSDSFRELNITSLVIPNTVESLGSSAFYRLTSLWSLTIPITLNSVGPTNYPAFTQTDHLSNLNFTAGSNGIGYDYTDCTPVWNCQKNYGFTVTFDSGIQYIGTNTISKYNFVDENGQFIEQTAANLSGQTYQGENSTSLYQYIDSPEQSEGIPITEPTEDLARTDTSAKTETEN